MPPPLAGQRPLCCFAELHRQELDSLAVQCKYGASEYGTKAWCRRDQTRCKIWATTDDFLSWTNKKALEGRVWMQDNPQQRTVTITMQKLQARDTGVYWCVLYTSAHPSRIMEVKLSVSKREYPPAAQGGCWEISAPPPLLVLPPALRHPEEQHCCRAADTHVSACLSLWRTRWQLPLGRRSPSSGLALLTLSAASRGSGGSWAPSNGAPLRSGSSQSSFPGSALSCSAPHRALLETCPLAGVALAVPHSCLPSLLRASQRYRLSAWEHAVPEEWHRTHPTHDSPLHG